MTVIKTETETETETETFQLPIYYNEKKRLLKSTIAKDLELAHTQNENNENNEKPVYHYVMNIEINDQKSKNEYLKNIVEKTIQHYTTDTNFLKDNQKLLKDYQSFQKENQENIDLSSIIDSWREMKNDNGFKEKYFYIDWPFWQFLNKSDLFLQIMSIYNLSAPVLSLLLPILILIFPFFIIKMRGLEITMNEYIIILKMLASNHAFGKLFTEWNSVELNHKIYLVISALFYVFSIYQNFLLCIRFYSNMSKIHDYIEQWKQYIHYTSKKIDHYLSYTQHLKSHLVFNQNLKEKQKILDQLYVKLNQIQPYPYSIFSFSYWKKILEIGYVLKCFYELYDDPIYHKIMEYTFEFHCYVDCIEGIQKNIDNRQMNFADFCKRENRNQNKKNKKNANAKASILFKDNYYAVLKDQTPVKNDVSFEKNVILTGPNASGKTTVLKSILINILLSQQIGCGFYGSAELNPFDYIHCYLNIPDTSGRDSLFQAEAKRCKEILDSIDENSSEERHFCAFDEIYSGTNPEEATLSTVAFINYLVKYKNVSCILTSHFIKACKKLDKNKKIANFHLVVKKYEKDSMMKYTYLLKKGISSVKGGIQILKEMNYPQTIIDQTQFVNSKI